MKKTRRFVALLLAAVLALAFFTACGAAQPTIGQVPKFRFRVLFTHVIIAITTAGGTEIHAAMISHAAKNPTCLLIPTEL